MKNKVSINDLSVGDSIGDDIKAKNGQTLVAKGTILNDNHLEKLRRWFGDSDLMFTVETEKPCSITENNANKEQMEQLQNRMVDYIDRVFHSSGEDFNNALQRMSEDIFHICEDLKSITDLPNDTIRITYQNKPGSHYFRVARMAVSLASIYNQNKPLDKKISLPSICLSSLLYDYGKRYKNDPKGLESLPFNTTTLKGTNILPSSINRQYDESLHTVYSYVAFKGKVPEDVRKTILYCNYKDLNSLRNVRAEVKAASIISLCNVYDKLLEHAMHTDLPSPFENILSYIGQLAHNGEMDPEIYQLFLDHIPIYPHGVKVLLSTGEEALVVAETKGFPTKPSVLVLSNGKTNMIHLKETTNITIRKVLEEGKQTDDKVDMIQNRQLQSSPISLERESFIPTEDASSTLELQNETFHKSKVLDKKLKNFFGRRQ